MPQNDPLPNWYIGGDPWKNTLRLECQAFVETQANQPPRSKRVAIGSATCGDDSELGKRSAIKCEIITNGEAAPSYLISQAGRLFLVRPTAASISKAIKQFRERGRAHLHVILLEPDKEVVKKLVTLSESTSSGNGRKPSSRSVAITIWTSYWIWEQCEFKPSRAKHSKPEQAKLGSESSPFARMPDTYDFCTVPRNTLRVFLFGRNRTTSFTLGVTLTLRYSISAIPTLRAEFVCNNYTLVIDPILASAALNSKKHGTSVEGLEALVNQIKDKCSSYLPRHPELARLIERRGRELSGAVESLRNGERLFVSRDLLFLRRLGFDEPVFPMPSMSEVPAVATNNRRRGEGSRKSVRSVLDDTVIVFLCGGLLKRQDRELIDVSYELDINGKSSSIIEWRLGQLETWAKENNATLKVILLTTPDTESTVQAISKPWREPTGTHDTKSVEVCVFAAQLIAVQEGIRQWTAFDGGWDLTPYGHLDALRCLWGNEVRHFIGDRRRGMIVAHNNLGRVFDGEAIAHLSGVSQIRTLAVEMFQYSRRSSDDSRWRGLSWDDGTTKRDAIKLLKVGYRDVTEPEAGKPAFYSSLTWYVAIDSPLAECIGTVMPCVISRDACTDSSGKSASSKAGKLVVRRDLDMVSQVTDVVGYKHGPAEGEECPKELIAYDRYLGVRTLDHVSTEEFVDAFARAHHLNRDKTTLPDDEQWKQELQAPFLTVAPNFRDAAWGGHDLPDMKGVREHFRDRRIGETWEISTLRQGCSSVVMGAKGKVPLNQVLVSWASKHKIKVDVAKIPMIKYLDCHGPLSLQVHPDAHTAKFLDKQKVNQGYRLRDDGGKDESFLVLQPGTEQGVVPLFLGFDSEKLEPMAAAIRWDVERLPVRQTQPPLQSIVRKIADSFSRICAPAINNLLNLPSKNQDIEMVFNSEELCGDGVLERVMAFHYTRPNGPGSIEDAADANLAAGLEYLFAGVVFIRMIELLKEKVSKICHDLTTIRKLFGSTSQGTPWTLAEANDHPLLRFFKCVSLNKECVVRIPAGVVHSWQGCRSFLIEVAQRSDNTFRILDFGREIAECQQSAVPLREMHYEEAMYSLSRLSFLDCAAVDKLCLPLDFQPGGSRPLVCHDAVACRLFRHAGEHRVQPPGDIAFILNPDGRLRVTADPAGTRPTATLVERCGALIVNGKTDLTLIPENSDDRTIVLRPRAPSRVFCISLGDARWEVAKLVECSRDHERRFSWWPISESERNVETVIRLLGNHLQPKAMRRDMLGIARSGYKDCRGDFYTTDAEDSTWKDAEKKFKNFAELSDVHADLLGEIRHPIGRLRRDEPAMVIHIDRGMCFGYYHPEVYARKYSGDETANASNSRQDFDRVFADERLTVCSAVGRWLYRLSDGRLLSSDQVIGANDWRPAIWGSVFSRRPTSVIGNCIRASKYFSAAGIVAASQSIDVAGQLDLGAFQRALPLGDPSKTRQAERDIGLRDRLRELFGHEQAESLNGLNLVHRYAVDLAHAICRGIEMLRRMPSEYSAYKERARPNLEPLAAADFEKLAAECPQHIVLTGLVGQYFGLTDLDGVSSERDVLAAELRHELRNRGILGRPQPNRPRAYLGGPTITRSRIGVTAERQAYGFLYYFEEHDQTT